MATAETGTVEQVLVREGEAVQEGQVLAKLDDQLHLLLLSIAKETMESRGGLDSAMAELRLRQERLEKLQTLLDKGHARQEEVERARTDLAVAQARALSANEKLGVKKLEHRKMQVQVERRTIHAPMNGVVTKIHKKRGEYVGPSDPQLLQMVILDPLLAKFALPSQRARKFTKARKSGCTSRRRIRRSVALSVSLVL